MHPESSTIKYLKTFKCQWFLLPVVSQQQNYLEACLFKSDVHMSILLGFFFKAKIFPLAVEVISPCIAVVWLLQQKG